MNSLGDPARRRICAISFACACTLVLMTATASASADTTLGSGLEDGYDSTFGGTPGITVYQVAAPGETLTVPANGTISSWSVRSGDMNAEYRLRIVRPAGGGKYAAVGTSAAQRVPDSGDAVRGPFAVSLPVRAGDRIALDVIAGAGAPINNVLAPIADELDYFADPFIDGAEQNPVLTPPLGGSQELLLQANFKPEAASPPSEPTPQPALQNTSPPQIAGTPKAGQTLTCNPGSWLGSPSFTYQWSVTSTASLPSLPAKWIKRSALGRSHPRSRTIALKWRAGIFPSVTQPLAGGQTLIVPDDPVAGTTLACEVTAARGSTSLTASAQAVALTAAAPVLAISAIAGPKQRGPHITPNVGAGATNHCTSGVWAHHPTSFAYAWYKVIMGRGHRVRSTKLLHTGQDFTLREYHERDDVECAVTASNAGGATIALSNNYIVPANAAKLIQGPFIQVRTLGPTGSGLVGPLDEGATFIAEQVHLSCGSGRWSRGDLTFSIGWAGTDTGHLSSGTLYEAQHFYRGSELNFDMRPGHEEFPGQTVQCYVLATTSHGVVSLAESALIHVWSGCAVIQESSPNAYGNPVPTGMDETYGPNCLNYQRYNEARGDTVKQIG